MALPTLLGVTLLTFLLFHAVGGDPAFQYAGKNASPELIESLRQELGLNQPLWMQYVQFLKQTFTFSWGQSWSTHQPISEMFWQGLGPSLCLTLPAFVISVLLSLVLALLCVYHRHRFLDSALQVIFLAMMSVSFLVYILFFQKWLAFDLSLFPVYGWDPSWWGRWQYLSLSWIIYVLVSVGPKALLFRAALMEELHHDYVRTAMSKGVSNFSLYLKHVFRNALVPVLTLVMVQMPSLITGSLLLEAFFGIPGLGGLLVRAIQSSDFPVIKAMTVFGAMVYIAVNILNDLLYYWFEPRMKLR